MEFNRWWDFKYKKAFDQIIICKNNNKMSSSTIVTKVQNVEKHSLTLMNVTKGPRQGYFAILMKKISNQFYKDP